MEYSEEDIKNFKQKISFLENQNKKLNENQIKLGEITNNHMMLYYLVKNVNDAKTTNNLWLNYLSSILDSGFSYSEAFVLLPNNSERNEFNKKLSVKNYELVKDNFSISNSENFIKNCYLEKVTTNSSDNTKVAIPLVSINNLLIAILVAEKETAITFEDTQLLEIYTMQTVSTIENLLLNEKLTYNQSLLAEKLDQFVMLHYISKEINDCTKYHDVLEKYLDASMSPLGFNCNKGVIYILENSEITVVEKKNNKLNFKKINKLEKEHITKAKDTGLHSFGDSRNIIAMPLNTSSNNISAILELSSDKEFTNEDIQMIDIFSMQTATMLENTKLNYNLEHEVELRTIELKEAYEELKELDKLKDEFLGMISHELNTPLTPVLAYIETVLSSIEKGNIDEKMIKEFLQIAHIEAERLKSIISKMIEFTKLEANKLIYNYTSASITEISKEIFEKMKSQFSNKLSLTWDLKFDNNIPNINIDVSRYIQILENILSNAINFNNKNGKIKMNIYTKENNVIIAVSDTGIGIPKKYIKTIFSRFKQMEKIEHHSKGIGLGLPLTKMLVEQMNGKIEVDTQVNEGSTFYISFPIN